VYDSAVGPCRAQEFIGAQRAITTTGAPALVVACLAYARAGRANNQRAGSAVVDPYGNLLDYRSMEDTNVIAGESAILEKRPPCGGGARPRN
jgi:hypothetical protein